MKKIILTLISCLLLSFNTVDAKSVKFVQVTDVLYGKNNTQLQLQQAISEINKMPDIDFVVFTGDNISTANEALLKSFITEVKKLNKPFYVTVGDKDVSKSKRLDKETYAKKLHKFIGHKYPETLNYTFSVKKSKVLFIVVDGAKDFITMPNGYFNDETLKWLEKQIQQNKNKKIVILQHFPIANKTNNDLMYTANAIQYLKLINKYENVISLVAGHFNKNDEISLNGIYYIVTPSLTQNCYKIIEIDEDNGYQIFTSLVRMDSK